MLVWTYKSDRKVRVQLETVTDLRAVICESGEKLGYKGLKDKQVEAMCSFTEGNDVFVSLPTGYGKSTIIYAILPFVFDKIRGMVTNNSNCLVRDVRYFWKYSIVYKPLDSNNDGPS